MGNHNDGLRPGDRLADFDFDAHNAEVQAAWDAFHASTPTRTPVILGINARYFLPILAAQGRPVDFRAYTENPDIMFDTLLEFQR